MGAAIAGGLMTVLGFLSVIIGADETEVPGLRVFSLLLIIGLVLIVVGVRGAMRREELAYSEALRKEKDWIHKAIDEEPTPKPVDPTKYQRRAVFLSSVGVALCVLGCCSFLAIRGSHYGQGLSTAGLIFLLSGGPVFSAGLVYFARKAAVEKALQQSRGAGPKAKSMTALQVNIGVLGAAGAVFIVMGGCFAMTYDISLKAAAPALIIVGLVCMCGAVGLFFLRRKQQEEQALGGSTPAKVVSKTGSTPAKVVSKTEPIPAPKPTLAGLGEADNRLSIFKRSNNILATIKDYVRHESDEATSGDALTRKLARMLNMTGIMQWEDPPIASVTWFESGHCFIKYTFSQDTTFEERLRYCDIMTACESALNIFHDAVVLLGENAGIATSKTVDEVCEHILDSVLDRGDALSSSEDGDSAGRIDETRRNNDEWEYRKAVLIAMYGYPFPLHCSIDFRCDLSNGTTCMMFEIPRTGIYAILDGGPLPNRARDIERSRMHALRTALVAARIAFNGSNRVERVVVLCHEMGKSDALLSLDLNLQSFLSLCDIVETMPTSDFALINTLLAKHLEKEGIPALETDALRFRLNDEGDFSQVEPHLSPDDELVDTVARGLPAKTDHRACPPRLAEVSGARCMSDFEIDEAAGRVMAWAYVENGLGDSCSQAVRVFNQLLAYAKGENADYSSIDKEGLDALPKGCIDATVIDACMRTSFALVEGALAIEDMQEVRNQFLFVDSLSSVLRSMHDRRSEDREKGELPSPEEISVRMNLVEKAIESGGQRNRYVDTRTTVWRNFDSLSERIVFNKLLWDGESQVNLVPSSYIMALHMLADYALILNLLHAARTYIEELVHLCPVGVYERNLEVRLLQQEDRYFAAEHSLKEGLKLCGSTSDIGILLYRLAYIEWMLGNNDVCSACYAQSEKCPSQMQEQAHIEYEEHIADEGNDIRRLSVEEAEVIMKREGIEIPQREEWFQDIETIAQITCDMGLFPVAKPLAAQLFNNSKKNYYKGIYYSFGDFGLQ